MSWQEKLASLTESVETACATAYGSGVISVKCKNSVMYNADDEVPVAPIGMFHEYHVVRVEVRPLFGIRWLPIRISHTLVMLGIEEMFELPRYTRSVWCAVKEPSVVEAVRPLLKAFAAKHGLRLDFAPSGAACRP